MSDLSSVMVVAAHAAKAHAHRPSNWVLSGTGLIGGFAVGITGMGGGALMTPLLVLALKVDPKVAIASDLVNSLVMKPVGGGVHARRGTIHWGLVVRLVAGSIPAAFLGAYTLNQFGDSAHVQAQIKTVLGVALIVACLSLLAKAVLARRTAGGAEPNAVPYKVKTIPTVLVGVAGGFIVGMTSVGSGSLMIVLLMLLYPRLSSKSLVGTDLVQAVPLVASAALGQFVFGHINFGIAGALILGSIPGVYLGARVSAKAPDGIVRPVLMFVLSASALALLFGNNNRGLAISLVAVLLVGGALWAAVDGATRPTHDWTAVGQNRTTWVALMGIGAPFAVGFVAALAYAAGPRRRLVAVQAARSVWSAAEAVGHPPASQAEVDAPEAAAGDPAGALSD